MKTRASAVSYWEKEKECLPVSQLRELQLERFKKTLRLAWNKVPYYRRKMQNSGVTPADIKSLADIQKLPFTTKEDLRL